VIKFQCKHCGQKIKIPEVHSGKKGKCPKCKNTIVVPEINDDTSLKLQYNDTDNLQYTQQHPEPELRLKKDFPNQTRLDGLSADGLNVTNELLKSEIKEKPSERKLPWILDIFLYPTSMSGVIHLVIFPVGVCLLWFLISINLFCFMRLLSFVLLCIFVGYILYFLADCVRESAAGEIRALDTVVQSNLPDKWECIKQMIYVLDCFSVCFSTAVVYFVIARRLDWILGLLAGYGLVIFPMTLLSIVMFDSFVALNPILVIGSIISTIFVYLGLLIFFYGLCVLVILISRSLPISIISFYITITIALYFAMVSAHLLGRFYYLNSEKLNWEV